MSKHNEEAMQVITDAISDTTIDPVTLIGKLMSANFRDYSNTVTGLMEIKDRQISDLKAELGAIRRRINELLSGDYMPTESAIIEAVFHPSQALIESCREKQDEK